MSDSFVKYLSVMAIIFLALSACWIMSGALQQTVAPMGPSPAVSTTQSRIPTAHSPAMPEHPYIRPNGTRFRILTNGERYKIQEWKWTPRLNLTPVADFGYDWVDVTGGDGKTLYFGGLWAAQAWIKAELTEHPSPNDKWVEVK